MDWENILENAERELRRGQIDRVRSDLNRVPWRKVPRANALRLANLFRRLDDTTRGLALLTPIVRPEKPLRIKASPSEVAEYAVLLNRAGSSTEAMSLLSGLSPSDVPEVSLYRAFACFALWDYPSALPHLHLYVAKAVSPYQQNVGLVNLTAALIATGDWAGAGAAVDECLRRTRSVGNERLHANSLELLAQMLIEQKFYAQALEALKEASLVLNAQKLSEALYIKKWRAIAEALKNSDPGPLQRFESEAHESGDWENLRDVQFFSLKLGFSRPLFEKLVFGTANPHFRAKVLRTFPGERVGERYVFGGEKGPVLDLASGHVLRAPTAVAFEGKIHQLLYALTRDLYRPSQIGSLFSELYPGEHFDIFSSPDRLHQILRRARREFRAAGLGLTVRENRRNYRLEAAIGLRVPLQRESVHPVDQKISQLHKLNLGNELNAGQIQQALNLSKPEYRWFINSAINRGAIIRTGRRAASRYRIGDAKK